MNKQFNCVLVAAAVLVLGGCSKVTKQNYDKIEMGMTRPDVEMILGNDANCEQQIGTYSCLWGDPDGKYIKINFIGGRAVVFTHQGLDEK